MYSKQTLIQEIDALPPDFIDDVGQYVSFLKFKAKTPNHTDMRLKEFDHLVDLIHAASDEEMPAIEPLRFREAEV